MRQRLTFLITSLAILILISSCASFGPTEPNVSIIDPKNKSQSDANLVEAQTILYDIAAKNDLLARELGKLPELQDGVEQKDLEALRVIQSAYQEYQKEFDAAFAEMYKVGKPEVRRYCSPLQAVFWLAEDNDIKLVTDMLHDGYETDKLIKHSWKSRSEIKDLYMKEEAKKLIVSCNNEETKKIISLMDNNHEYYYLMDFLILH